MHSSTKFLLSLPGQWIGKNLQIAPKALNSSSAALGFQSIAHFLLNSA